MTSDARILVGVTGASGSIYAERLVEVLKPLVKKNVKAIVCLGVNNIKIHEAFSKHVDILVNTSSAIDAVKMAAQLAEKGDAVLLSPACASFDLFENYEDRGNQFKKAVRNL